MRDYRALAFALGGLCVFQAGWMAAGMFDSTAHAEEPAFTDSLGQDELAAAPYPGKLRCNLFPTALSTEPYTLPDGTNEPGQWVQQHAGEWQLFSTDFEVSQKPTGYPQGWLTVCLYPR
jgi:hypothetical protein